MKFVLIKSIEQCCAEFADITWEEFNGHYLGASQNCSATKSSHKLTDAEIPAEVIQ